MSDDPRVEPLAKRMLKAMWPNASFALECYEGSPAERAACLALSLIDARVKVARKGLRTIAEHYPARSYAAGSVAENALRDLDALARELEPEPKEPTLEQAVETLLAKKWHEGVVSAELFPKGDVDAVRAALERAKASDTAEGRARAKGGQS